MRVKLDDNAFLPTRAHEDDAGLDLYAIYDGVVPEMYSEVIETGVHIEIPKGCVGFIKTRSSMLRSGILTDGTIDSGYTGTIKVCLFNTGMFHYEIHRGDRIAQLVVVPCLREYAEPVENLSDTERGSDGFGSSGR